jgi:hypothetical protein
METNSPPDAYPAQPGQLRAPFTKDELRRDIVTVLLAEARRIHFLFDRPNNEFLGPLFGLLGLKEVVPADAHFAQVNWTEVGLRYESVRTTAFAAGLESLYELAFAGEVNIDLNGNESPWEAVCLLEPLTDLSKSHLVGDPEAVESAREAIGRCLRVCETAQARLLLEGLADQSWDTTGATQDGLSIRQLSLLSGMTEASLRTLANPKRSNPLKTQSDGKNTFVVPAEAKDWLISKGRYSPLKRHIKDPAEDLTKRSFEHPSDILYALDRRLTVLLRGPEADKARLALLAISPDLIYEGGQDQDCPEGLDLLGLQVSGAMLADAELMTRIGDALSLNGQLVALRAAETLAAHRLNEIRGRLLEASPT